METTSAVDLSEQEVSAQCDFRNPSLPVATRVHDLISRMTLAEKVSQTVNVAAGIERLGIPPYDRRNECLHGVGRAGIATVFPQAIGLASTWNTALMQRVAVAISDEARAKHHDAMRRDYHKRYPGSPTGRRISIFSAIRAGDAARKPTAKIPYPDRARWAWRLSRACRVKMRAISNWWPPPSIMPCTAGRRRPPPIRWRVSPRDLRETYLPAFKALVEEAQVAAVMGAYNRMNGEACNASTTLLREILRGEWGFSGHVVSDCGAVEDIYEHHTAIPHQGAGHRRSGACRLRLCCGAAYESLDKAVQGGYLREEELDTTLERLFTTRFRLGMFDPPESVPYAQIPNSVVDCPEHRALALQSARESIVLLKNDGILPLAEGYHTIGVLGPNAHNPEVLLGNYNGTAVACRHPAGRHHRQSVPARECADTGGLRPLRAGRFRHLGSAGNDRQCRPAHRGARAIAAAGK